MKSSYNFEEQIRYLNKLSQINITFAQSINTLLPFIPKQVLTKIKNDLIQEYEQIYKEKPQILQSIKNTLHLAAREQVTDMDKLFMDFASELNDHYKKELFTLTKSMAYFKICPKCQKGVANDELGLKWHSQVHKQQEHVAQGIAPQKKAKKKVKDTQQKYEERQKKVPNHPPQEEKPQICQSAKNPSKRQSLQLKKKTKSKKQKARAFIEEKFKKSNNEDDIYVEEEEEEPKNRSEQPTQAKLKTERKLNVEAEQTQKLEKIHLGPHQVQQDDFFD